MLNLRIVNGEIAHTNSRIVRKTEKLDAAVLLDVQFTPAGRKLHRCCDVVLFELFCLR